jgi:hypothetical protein
MDNYINTQDTHPVVGLPAASPFSLAVLFNLDTGSMLSSFCCSFETGGGFSGMVGCTPSIHNQCAATKTVLHLPVNLPSM